MNGDIDLVEWIESQEEVLVSVEMRQRLGQCPVASVEDQVADYLR
jgi:hypothetical protein